MTTRAIAFDFDGTLIQNGPCNLDKGVHILFSSWYACRNTELRKWLAPEQKTNLEKMIAAYIRYPGSPRFEQFSAIADALLDGPGYAVTDLSDFNRPLTETAYQHARETYNRVYSALNNAAAELFWRPYPSVKKVLYRLSRDFTLYIASGVTQDILEQDLDRHQFDRSLFAEIQGGNTAGGNDKGQILARLKKKHPEILFVADSNKDLEYARQAGVSFYRISSDADYQRLAEYLPETIPNQTKSWDFTASELDFFYQKTSKLIQNYQDAENLPYPKMTQWIQSRVSNQ